MDDFFNYVRELERRVRTLERALNLRNVVLPSTGTLRPPRVSVDPSSPTNGDIWYNTTTNQLKVRVNGVTRVVTVT